MRMTLPYCVSVIRHSYSSRKPTMTSSNLITQRNAKAARQDFQGNKWGQRHFSAFESDSTGVAGMLRAWARYADQHRERYDASIGDDGVLGPEWAAIGMALLGLLNGE